MIMPVHGTVVVFAKRHAATGRADHNLSSGLKLRVSGSELPAARESSCAMRGGDAGTFVRCIAVEQPIIGDLPCRFAPALVTGNRVLL